MGNNLTKQPQNDNLGILQKFRRNKNKIEKGYTVWPVLIHAGELAAGIEEEDYFDRILDFDKLLSNP